MAVELAEPIAAEGPVQERFASFEAFYRRYQPALVSTCTGLTGSRAAAEDLAQETLLRAFEHIDGLDVTRAWGWLKTVASRLAIDDARKTGRLRPLEDDGAPERPAEGSPNDPTEDRLLLQQALSRLPARQRAAVALRYLADYDLDEAAAFLRIDHSAFKQLLFRARRKLRAEYRGLTAGLAGIALWPALVLRRARRAATTVKLGFARSRFRTLLHPTVELGAVLLVIGSLSLNPPAGRASGPPAGGVGGGSSGIVSTHAPTRAWAAPATWNWRSWMPAQWFGAPSKAAPKHVQVLCYVSGQGGDAEQGLPGTATQTIDGVAPAQVGSAGAGLGCSGSGTGSSPVPGTGSSGNDLTVTAGAAVAKAQQTAVDGSNHAKSTADATDTGASSTISGTIDPIVKTVQTATGSA